MVGVVSTGEILTGRMVIDTGVPSGARRRPVGERRERRTHRPRGGSTNRPRNLFDDDQYANLLPLWDAAR
jgi:hypothetical protein